MDYYCLNCRICLKDPLRRFCSELCRKLYAEEKAYVVDRAAFN